MESNQEQKKINETPDTPEEEIGKKSKRPGFESGHKDEKIKKELENTKKELQQAQNDLEVFQKSLKSTQDELAGLKDQFMRTAAEFDNFKKRTQKEKDQMYADATACAAAKLLPALDNLERALTTGSTGADLQKGVEMTFKQLSDAFISLGVECMELESGCPFDPQFHNAVLHVEDENLPENSVAEVLQKGYTIGDKVVRHAVVKAAN